MVAKICGAVLAIFLTVASGVLVHHFTRDVPDVRYALSEDIPVSFLSSPSKTIESIQQLEVRNIGDAAAERILVRINTQVTAYEINKHMISAKVEAFSQEQPVEFLYHSLPPDAGFSLVLKTPAGIKPGDLTVAHTSGLAKEALADSGLSVGDVLGVVYFTVFFVGLCLFLVVMLYNSIVDSIKSKSRGSSIDKLLALKQPWYISEGKWRRVHAEIIRDMVTGEYVYTHSLDIINASIYLVLFAQKPSHLDEIEWKEITVSAIDRLENKCSDMATSYDDGTILYLLRLERPPYFPRDKWNKILVSANEHFASRQKEKYYPTDELLTVLKGDKPEGVSDMAWNKVREYLRKCYYNDMVRDVELAQNANAWIEKADLEVLNANERNDLNQRAANKFARDELLRLIDNLLNEEALESEKPSALNELHWMQIKRIESIMKKSTVASEYASVMLQCLSNLMNWRALDLEKPHQLSDKDWGRLKALEDKVNNLVDLETHRTEVASEHTKLASQIAEVSTLKSRIQRQLDIIDSLLKDPCNIDRLEFYDDAFSPGNVANLKRLSQLLTHTATPGRLDED
jgi:hypothetical protein